MAAVTQFAVCLAHCNLHPCLYAALAMPFFCKALTALRERRHPQAPKKAEVAPERRAEAPRMDATMLEAAFALIAKTSPNQVTPLASAPSFAPSPERPMADQDNNDAVPRYMLSEAEYIRTFGLSH